MERNSRCEWSAPPPGAMMRSQPELLLRAKSESVDGYPVAGVGVGVLGLYYHQRMWGSLYLGSHQGLYDCPRAVQNWPCPLTGCSTLAVQKAAHRAGRAGPAPHLDSVEEMTLVVGHR